MAEITASLVKELREKTGAGMMDCKKALGEVAGDLEKAIDWLRTKGLSAAAKKAGRVAAEGLVGVVANGTRGAVIEVNAETDFVGRNDMFQKFVGDAAKIALDNGGDLAKVAAAPYPGTGRDVQGELTHLIATIGENMSLRRAGMLSVSDGIVASYMHNKVAPDLGKIGVLVALESTGDKAKLEALAKQLAMHVASANPQVADRRRPRQGRGRARARCADREGCAERQGCRHHRQDGRGRHAQGLPGSGCCSSRPSSSTARPRSPRWSTMPPSRSAPRSVWRAICASPWARASRRSPRISRQRWLPSSRSSMTTNTGAQAYGPALPKKTGV